MRILKKFLSIILFLNIVLLQVPVYADDNLEEEVDNYEINSFIEEVGAEVQKVPDINSRHAVVYDRRTRYNFIREKRSRKM